ncbi:MAG: MiaB/RimO family radical SAM methylthiotransferase [Anaerolineae bacterium]|nr:MiaB/RimO family radical SAM methylthiotransferase [Anaerolineae bacterium]
MKVFLDTVGCRLNQSEIEKYARQFRAAGHILAGSLQEADMIVLNTCAVTAAASSDSRQKIRQAHKAGVKEIIVTGCMSTLAAQQTANIPGVTRVVPNAEKDSLVPDLLQIEINEYDIEPIIREPLPGSRSRTRAFIKVQDGCDNKCTFCVTTIARGPGRSRTAAEIITDIQAALQGGVKEVVLTGVHLGSWGQDFPVPAHLKALIQTILDQTDIPRLRVSSLEPWDLEADFFDLWQDERLCRHLHLPLQSGSAATLRRMARKTSPSSFAALTAAARERIPDAAITTDIIAGFPGESRQEFEESCDFVREMQFAGAHIFTYSPRQNTAAASMPGQVQKAVRKARSAALREITAASAEAFQSRFLGRQVDVLWESAAPTGTDQWQLSGLTDNYLRVVANAPQPLWNQITPVELTACIPDGLQATLATLPDSIILGGAYA